MIAQRWVAGAGPWRVWRRVPWKTHIGVAGPVPPSLAQTVLPPNGWPGRSRGQWRNEAVGDRVEGCLTVGKGSQGLTWGCRSDGWKMIHRHHMTCCSHPMESTGPRPHLHPLAETQRGHTLVCSTTGGRMREEKGKGRKGMSVTLQSSGFNASCLSTIPQIIGAVHSGMGECNMRKGWI